MNSKSRALQAFTPFIHPASRHEDFTFRNKALDLQAFAQVTRAQSR